MADLGFTTSQEMAEEFSNFEIATPGWKRMVIIKTELKDTSTGGKMLVLSNEIQGVEVPGEAGIVVVDRLNIINKSEDAQRIGRAALAKITHECLGLPPISDSDQLCGIPYDAKVVIEKFESNKEKGKMLDSNKIKDYRKASKTAAAVSNSAANNQEMDW